MFVPDIHEAYIHEFLLRVNLRCDEVRSRPGENMHIHGRIMLNLPVLNKILFFLYYGELKFYFQIALLLGFHL